MQHYKGSPAGIKLLLLIYRLSNYGFVKLFIRPIALFYAFLASKRRHELCNYYSKVNLPCSMATYCRHVYAFALMIFDRLIASEPAYKKTLVIERINYDKFEQLAQSGGIIILSHFGNRLQSFKAFEMSNVKLNLVADEQFNPKVLEMEQESVSNERVSIININEGIGAILKISTAIRNKEIVIMTVDRLANPKHTLAIDFLGEKARFNSAPFEIAQKLKSPIVAFNTIRADDGVLRLEVSDLILPGNDKTISALMTQYAAFMEDCVRRYPLQWFNFYDFYAKA